MDNFTPDKPFGGVPVSVAVVEDGEGSAYLSLALGPYPGPQTANTVKEALESLCVEYGIPVKIDELGGFMHNDERTVN